MRSPHLTTGWRASDSGHSLETSLQRPSLNHLSLMELLLRTASPHWRATHQRRKLLKRKLGSAATQVTALLYPLVGNSLGHDLALGRLYHR